MYMQCTECRYTNKASPIYIAVNACTFMLVNVNLNDAYVFSVQPLLHLLAIGFALINIQQSYIQSFNTISYLIDISADMVYIHKLALSPPFVPIPVNILSHVRTCMLMFSFANSHIRVHTMFWFISEPSSVVIWVTQLTIHLVSFD